MTIEERFERMEHVTAGLDEQRRKDREENRQIWRDTQRQINELSVRLNDLTLKVADTNDAISRLAEENRVAHEQFREADKKLGDRIDSLVSAIGEFLRKRDGGTQ